MRELLYRQLSACLESRQLARLGRYVESVKALQVIIADHAGTPQAREAKEALFLWGVEGMKIDGMKDEDLKTTVGPAVEAHRLLGQGWRHLEREHLDKAKAVFDTVVEKFPQTVSADHARNGLIEVEERQGDDDDKDDDD